MPLELFDNLSKQTPSPSHRSIQVGRIIRVKVPGSEKGLLVGALFSPGRELLIVRYDGVPGNLPRTQDDPTGIDDKDGVVEIPTTHPLGNKGILLPIDNGYTLHVQAYDSQMDMIPNAWNIQFDITD